jgi:ABC-2 type transport system permease protein
MFWQIFSFEIKYRLKRPATYIYFGIFLLLTALIFGAGWINGSEKVHYNSPVYVALVLTIFSMAMLFVCSAVMGVPLYRDIDHNTKGYYLTYPITEAGYFWGRYLGSFVFVILIGTSLIFGGYLGSFLGPLVGAVPAKRMGPNHLMYYLQPFFCIVLTNLFFASSIFFGLVAFTRNVKVIYTTSILLFIAYLLSGVFLRDLEHKDLVKILDPFAVNTFSLEIRFYTPAEQNTLMVPVKGLFLINRLLWTGVGLLILLITYFSFSFKRFFNNNNLKRQVAETGTAVRTYLSELPKATISFAGGYYRRIMFTMAKTEYLNITRDIYFRVILLGGTIFLILDYWLGNTYYSVPNLPLTVNLMDYKNYDYTTFIFIIIVFYTGETIHRDKSTRFDIINDALPTPDWVLYGSKLLGLIGLTFTLATIPMVVGIVFQLLKGFTDIRLDVYLTELYAITFPQFIQMMMLSFAVHMIMNNKFGGHGVAILIWVIMFVLRNVANVNYNLFLYSYTPNYIWSDMDGIGHMAKPVFWFNFYWLLFGCLLLVFSAMFFNRGVVSSFKERWSIFKQRFHGAPVWLSAVLLAGFLATGAYNYYNVSYINNYLTVKEGEQRKAEYEKTLKKYEKLAQPKITSLKMYADIFPMDRTVKVKGVLTMVNKTDQPISTLHLDGDGLHSYSVLYNGKSLTATYPLLYKRGSFNWFRPRQDTAMYRIYKLPAVLKPGDTALVEINSVVAYPGFTNSMSGTDIVYNGTFYAGGLPTMGYNADNELESDEKRAKYKLPEKKDDLPPQTDARGIRTLLFNNNADLVDYDITVSTVGDQIAVAPGYLQKEWKKDGRNYYRYVQDAPKVVLFFDIVSARYRTKFDSLKLADGKNVRMELYFHPPHTANLGRFMAAYRDGIQYYSKSYGDFQFKQMRLLEYPKYRTFAQSFPNTVSYEEGFGWVADFSDPTKFDYAYFVTAHELAHQWWGHQVVPNATRGANLISEALAEYTALILTERKYGKDNMKRFLKQEMDGYLRGRANEAKKENVFVNCNRPYEWYQKGSLILYGLQDLIGVDTLNKALHEFKDKYAFQPNPPFPGSKDLYNYINRHVPDSVKYYLDDTWNKITLYENKVIDFTSTPTGKKDEYKIKLKVSTRKMYADSAGNEKPALKMNDYMDIGVFAADSKNKDGSLKTNPLFLKKYKLTAGEHTMEMIVKGKPVRAGIDPYVKLIDRIPDDNVKDL